MKFAKLLLTTSLCAAVSGPALAQGKPFSEVDSDGSGSLSLEELASVFGQGSAERIMVRADLNGDGELSELEIRVRNDDESDDEEDDSDEEGGDESDDEENGSDEGDESDESDESDDEEDDDESDESDESDDEEDSES